MKVYRIVVRDVYEIEAKSPREAEYKLEEKWLTEWEGVHLDYYTQSKPKLIKKD